MKRFGDPIGKSDVYDEYRFCIKNPRRGGGGGGGGCNLYMAGYAVPIICSPLSGQRIENVEKLFPKLKQI